MTARFRFPRWILGLALVLLSAAAPAAQDEATELKGDAAVSAPSSDKRIELPTDNPVSPVRRIERAPEGPQSAARPRRLPLEFRSIDGSGNNAADPKMGAAGTVLRRRVPSDYSDDASLMAGTHRPGAREISNALCAQEEPVPNPLGASDYLWQWGQFLDHDIDLTGGMDPPEPANILVPRGDPWFDPLGSGTVEMEFNRSLYDPATGQAPGSPRQQINEITAWIDASNVYGSDEERAQALRTLDGTGRLRTSPGGLLPFNEDGLPNAGGPSDALFLAGDVRANEQAALTAMHTLFVREHNRLAEEISRTFPHLDGDGIYEKARQLVGAQMQVITYREYLPALLGDDLLEPYQGYDPGRDARIANAFSTGAYRFGHSALSSTLLRLDDKLRETEAGHLALREAFFAPHRITEEGIEPILRGLAYQQCQRIDPLVVDEVRNFLFGPPGAGGFDLAALNLHRGRDHGLPSYNDAREAMGLPRMDRFEQMCSDPELLSRLAATYENPDQMDLWAGGLAEDPLPGSHLGELFSLILKEQFEALRDADRFWYALHLTPGERAIVEHTTLADIIRRNTEIGREIPDDVFHVPPRRPGRPSRR